MSLEHSPVRQKGGGRSAHTIDEFCDEHRISRSMYYKLRDQGRAPVEMKIGTRVLISVEAAAQWRRDREAETKAA